MGGEWVFLEILLFREGRNLQLRGVAAGGRRRGVLALCIDMFEWNGFPDGFPMPVGSREKIELHPFGHIQLLM